MSRRVGKAVRASAIAVLIASGIGFIATLVLGAFVLDRYDAYGEAPIPGTGKVHLPVGQVTVSFHTVTVGNASGGGLPVPHLILDIDPPPGVADPKITENIGGSTSINNDIHRRVWTVQVLAAGDYIVTTSGDVNGYISPRMAFGHGGDTDSVWLGITVGLFVIALAGTIASSVWLSRAKNAPKLQAGAALVDRPVVVPSGEGVKIEQLKTLAALRDSGALTEKEFQAEKRRVLKGD